MIKGYYRFLTGRRYKGKMLLSKNKKGMSIGDLQAVGIMFVVIAVTLGLGASILTSIQGTQAANSYGANISGYGLSGVATLGQWLPTIALVVVISVIIGIIMMYLAKQARQ